MKLFFKVAFLVLIISCSLFAQAKDTVNVADTYSSGGTEGTLNDAVAAKIAAGTLSNTVFKLQLYGLYILTGTIQTPAGSVLEIVAPTPGKTQNTAPPMIAWTPSSAPNKRFNFDIGGEVRMKNLWILYGSTDGTQVGSSLRVGDSASVSGGKCTFDNVIFEYSPCPGSAAGAVEIFATHFVGKFNNCYFKNCTDTHFRYYGRAVSFRFDSQGLHADSLSFENCTFANMGYVVMAEKAEYYDNVYVNHCTFFNIMMFSFENPWWYKAAVTNSLFVNPFMFGYNPTNDGGMNPGGAIMDIDSVSNFDFVPPFTDEQRRIFFSNNAIYYQTCQQRQDDLIPLPRPMLSNRSLMFYDTLNAQGQKIWPYMNRANLYENIDPGIIISPTNMDSLKVFLNKKWDDNSNASWPYDIQNDINQVWPMSENLAYTNTTLKAAGMGGYPLGDLYRWWPTEYAQWKTQSAAEKTSILNKMENGITSVREISGNTIPDKYILSQNYPNPFNPTTQITYSVPKYGHVSLKVYNSLGQVVSTLVDGLQNAGNYEATFEAKHLSSGIYFYQLQSDNVSITKKLVLMK